MFVTLARTLLRLSRWKTIGEVPALKKAVFIAAPHTSNWDGFWLIIFKVAFDVRIRFLAKHTLFWWPLGWFLRALGAIPVNSSHPTATVRQLVDAFASEDHLFLALAPEGTRRWRPYWKTGFFQIAAAANVPIVLAFIDYGSKTMGIGHQIDTADGIEVNLQKIRKFYAPFKACHPGRMGPIEFPPRNGEPDSEDAPTRPGEHSE